MITTAVGPGALEKVAPALAAALVERAKRRPRDELHVVVIACENITDNTARLKEHIDDLVCELVSDRELREES